MPKQKQFDETTVVAKARDLFWLKGYHGTSMDELVQVTGLSRSSIYASFGDKHRLYLRSLEHYEHDQKASLETVLERYVSPKAKIIALFRYAAKIGLDQQNQNGCMMVNATTEMAKQDPTIATVVCDNRKKMEARLIAWIKAAQEQGEIAKKWKPKTLAHFLFSNFSGLRVAAQTGSTKQQLEDIVTLTVSVLDA